MATRQSGAVVLILGTQSPDFHCSCEQHEVCGSVVDYDTVLRIEKRVVSTGKSKIVHRNFAQKCCLPSFCLSDDNQQIVIGACRHITDSIAQCCVGRLSHVYSKHLDHLNGRLVQVIDLFSKSKATNKIAYNEANKGVVIAGVIDRYVVGDERLNALIDLVDIDEISDEEDND